MPTTVKRMTVDAMTGPEAMALMLDSHVAALEAIRGSEADLSRAAGRVAAAFEAGQVLHYAAAGSSGLMALADGCELPGTFRVPNAQIRIWMAGGVPADGVMPGDVEDSEPEAVSHAQSVMQGDVALVISASGTTPYAMSFAREAQERGAYVIGIANRNGSALLDLADLGISLDTAPEVVEGSTRLGAGTAQKVALNMISTQAGALLGHVHEGLMVNLHPDNAKLRRRAADIVQRLAGVGEAEAVRALEASSYDTKQAVLIASGADLNRAKDLLGQHRGNLRACLAALANMKN